MKTQINLPHVAISRAQCLAAVVANTRLVEISRKTVEQMKPVNTFCWLAEYAANKNKKEKEIA